jgi:hypothetical protein
MLKQVRFKRADLFAPLTNTTEMRKMRAVVDLSFLWRV